MTICKFCHAQLPDHAGFCGSCGRSQIQAEPMQQSVDHAATIVDVSDDHGASLEKIPTALLSSNPVSNDLLTGDDAETQISDNALTAISQHRSPDHTPISHPAISEASTLAYHDSDLPTMLLGNPVEGQQDDEYEDEKKRRLWLLGLAAPVVGAALLPEGNINQPLVSHNQLHANPALHGPNLPSHTPASGPGSFTPLPNPPTMQPLPSTLPSTLPNVPPIPSGYTGSPPGNSNPPSSNPNPPGNGTAGGASGCMPWLIVMMVVLIVLGSIFGLSVTIFSPAITLNGGQNVSLGGILQLNGNGFLPNTNIQLTLDNTTPLYMVSAPSQHSTMAYFSVLTIADNQSIALPYTQSSHSTLTTTSTGSFSVRVNVDTAWKLGPHTIHAIETISGRHANLTFHVTLQATPTPLPTLQTTQSLGATATAQATSTDTATATATDTAIPTQNAQAQLASVLPASVSFGPVAEGSAQVVSSSIVLQTSGNGAIHWSAVSDQQWLQSGTLTGQIQAPASQSIVISANPGKLSPGTYQGTITFQSQEGNVIVTLYVSLIVKANCIQVSPTALNFTGIADQNPPNQTLQLTNCGLAGPWSGSVSTVSGGNWLAIKPGNDTVNAGGKENVAVSILGAALGAGTYTGTITFNNGSARTTVSVTVVLAPPPRIIVTPTVLTSSNNCTLNASIYTCNVVVGNSSNQSPASWSATSNGTSGVGISPASGIIPAGQRVLVTLTFPYSDCGSTLFVTFSGPGNSVSVSWYCPPILR